MERENYQTGTIWERKVAYSRAVKIGNIIEVAGTVATDGKTIFHPNDPFLQTKYVLEKIKNALNALGGGLDDVVRTRMFVINIDQWEEIGKAHGEVFKGINPVTTMIEVSRLIDPGFLVEIEVTAMLQN